MHDLEQNTGAGKITLVPQRGRSTIHDTTQHYPKRYRTHPDVPLRNGDIRTTCATSAYPPITDDHNTDRCIGGVCILYIGYWGGCTDSDAVSWFCAVSPPSGVGVMAVPLSWGDVEGCGYHVDNDVDIMWIMCGYRVGSVWIFSVLLVVSWMGCGEVGRDVHAGRFGDTLLTPGRAWSVGRSGERVMGRGCGLSGWIGMMIDALIGPHPRMVAGVGDGAVWVSGEGIFVPSFPYGHDGQAIPWWFGEEVLAIPCIPIEDAERSFSDGGVDLVACGPHCPVLIAEGDLPNNGGTKRLTDGVGDLCP